MASRSAEKSKPQHGENRIIAKPKAGIPGRSLDRLRARHPAKVVRKFARLDNLEIIELDQGQELAATIAALKDSGLYEYVEPDYLIQTCAIPNDPLFGSQWGLHNTGQSGGAADADLDAPEAWDIQANVADVIVAVVDTGIRLDHEDLAANLWVNPGEFPGDGIDNDANGYVDDVHGMNAVSNNGDPSDDAGHGTHVAGIVGAEGNNGVGISGVAWQVKLMALKSLNRAGSGFTSDAIECLNYAITKGAAIVNASWGSSVYSQALYDAINSLRTNGLIFVTAAGNSAINLDLSFAYPAAFRLDNIVTVSATTRSNTVAFFSNAGYLTSDLGAPGYHILSTYFTNSTAYQTLSGTSMAAPHVAGALALLRGQLPSEHYLGLIYRLLNTVEVTPTLRGRCLSDGQLNLHRLLYDSAVSSPVNDHFTNRIQVTGAQWTRFARTLGAVKEPGEPNHAGHTGGSSIWWTWTAPYSGAVEFTTAQSIQTNGAALNTLLAVYTGTSVGNLAEVAANDDGNLIADGMNTSRVIFSAVAGTTYEIAVDAHDGTSGHVRLALAYSPQNDSLVSSYHLNGLYVACESSNFGATRESNEATIPGHAGGRSLWWSWRAPISGDFVITTEGSNFDTLLGVYTGSSHPLTLVVGNDDDTAPTTIDDYGGKTSALTFSAAEGQNYRIMVDGVDAQIGHIFLAGGYKVAIQAIAPTYAVNEDRAGRINQSNEIAGPWLSGTPQFLHGYYYSSANSRFTDWGMWQTNHETEAFGLNDIGQAVGSYLSAGYPPVAGHALIWDSVNGLRRLDNSDATSMALVINNNGLVGGAYEREGLKACYWLGNTIYELPVASPNSQSEVRDINEAGHIIGWVSVSAATPTSHGLLWRNVLSDVSVLQLGHRLNPSSMPHGINDRGEISGASGMRAVIWTELKPKPTGHLGFDSESWDINNLGQIVGTAKKYKWDRVRNIPILSQNGVDLHLDRLSPPGWGIYHCSSINDNGVIAGRAGNFTNSFLACAISPPSAIMFKTPTLLANDYFTAGIVGPVASCEIEACTDLTSADWTSLGTVTLNNGTVRFTDPDAPSYPQRFYRARSGEKLSANAAGYMIRSIPAGFSMVANPLHCADNRVSALMPGPPDGTTVWKYDADVQAYREGTAFVSGMGWLSDGEMTLNPGEGAMIQAPFGGFTNRWAGIVPQNCPRLEVLGSWQMAGSQTPVAGEVDTSLVFPSAHGDTISRMTSTDGTFTTYTYRNGNWSPSAPDLRLGESFFSMKGDASIWRQNLSVWR